MSMADQFEPLEVIGRGSFGLIRKARHKSDGKILARKEISYRQMNVKEKNQLMAEFRILKSLVYPNIVRYYYHDHVVQEHAVHLYMEYCDGGDLAGVIRTSKQTGEYVAESLVWSIFTQLALALYRCHYNSDPPPPDELGSNSQAQEPPVPSTIILHRDIKPDNVFLDQNNTVKLGDFGLAKILDQDHALANTYVGTPYYMSPEVLNDQPSTPQSDVWSLGCVIYELCAKHPPFQAKSHMQLSQRIKEGTFPPLPPVYSDLLGSTIASCLTQDFRARPTTAALLHTSMFNFCRKEREVEALKHDLEAARLEIEQARQELEESRGSLDLIRRDLETREQSLNAQEEELILERETLMSQLQEEQESFHIHMKALNQEFDLRVDQEVQRRLELALQGGRRHSADNSISQYVGSEIKQSHSENSFSNSSLLGTPTSIYSAQFPSNESTATSIQSTAYTSRSGVKGPRLIRDSSLNSNQSRANRKAFNLDDELADSNVPNRRLERKISGQSLASSHVTSISRMGSNTSAYTKTSPSIPLHNSFEAKQQQHYASSQHSPRKPSGSQNSHHQQQQQQQSYGQYYAQPANLPHQYSPPNSRSFMRSSPEKDSEMASSARPYSMGGQTSQSRHAAQPMDDSSNSSVSGYSLHSSHLSASSASSVEAEGNISRLSNEFSKQTLSDYPNNYQYMQGLAYNQHNPSIFEVNHSPTRSMSAKTDGYIRTKNDIQSLDDSSVTTLQEINLQHPNHRKFLDSDNNEIYIDDNNNNYGMNNNGYDCDYNYDHDHELMESELAYDNFKPKRSSSSPAKASHTNRLSPTKSIGAMGITIEQPPQLGLSPPRTGNGGGILTQHAFSNRLLSNNPKSPGNNSKSPVNSRSPGNIKSPAAAAFLSPATPRDRQAPHYQAIFTSGSSDRPSSDRSSRQASPEKATSRTNSPIFGAPTSYGHSKSTLSNSLTKSATPSSSSSATTSSTPHTTNNVSSTAALHSIPPNLKHSGPQRGVGYNENEFGGHTPKTGSSANTSPKKASPSRKPVKSVIYLSEDE